MKFFALVTLFNNDQTESTKKLKDIELSLSDNSVDVSHKHLV